MKKLAVLLAAGLVASAGAFADGATITITPPHVTDWTQTITYPGYGSTVVNASATDLQTFNDALDVVFGNISTDLNNNYFSKMKGFPKLNQGFANANAAAFDNASLAGYQNYDLFAVSVGGNLGVALPTLNPSAAQSELEKIVNEGDAYVGLGTGGFAAQAGLNLGLFIPNLYGTAKLGFIPEMPLGDASYSQGMFGVGANYSVIKGFDLLFGLVKWRGLNLGSGVVFNGNKVSVTVPVPAQSKTFDTAVENPANPGQFVNVPLTAKTTNTKMKLTVESSSVVVPIDLVTSVQALWLFNVGLGVGADLAISSGSVKVGGSSDLELGGVDSMTFSPGSVKLSTNDAKNGGDFFNPRVTGSLGLGLAFLKLDVPVSYYPLSKSFAFGFTGAIVW